MAAASVWNFIIFGYNCTKFSSHLPYSVVLFFPVCAVTDVSGKHESDLKWYELVWNPTCSGTCCSNTGLSAGQIQIKTEFKLGFIHKVSSELWSSAAPSYGCSYISAIFLHLTSLDNVLWKVSNPTTVKKIFQCWLVQGIPCHSDITSEELELGRYFLRCLSVRLFGRAGGCGEPRQSDTKMAQYWKGWRGKGQAPAHHRLCFGCTSAVRHERSALHLSWAELTDVPGWHCQASQ